MGLIDKLTDDKQYREDWFRFKQVALEEYVRKKIGKY